MGFIALVSKYMEETGDSSHQAEGLLVTVEMRTKRGESAQNIAEMFGRAYGNVRYSNPEYVEQIQRDLGSL